MGEGLRVAKSRFGDFVPRVPYAEPLVGIHLRELSWAAATATIEVAALAVGVGLCYLRVG